MQGAVIAATEIGYVLAVVFTITPATADIAKRHDIELVVVLAVLTFALAMFAFYLNDQHDKKSRSELVAEMMDGFSKALNAFAKASDAANVTATDVIPERQDIATAVVTPARGGFKIDLFELGEADKAAEAAGDNTSAAKRFQALPKPAGLRQQAFDLVNAVREALTEYHGTEEIDSFVSPEITRAFTKRLLAVKNKIEKFLNRRILRKESQFPVTVRRMRMFLDDVEQAAAELKDDIPPVV